MLTSYKRLFFLLLALVPQLLFAQVKFYQHDTTVKVYNAAGEQTLAWCGGFNNPQFAMGDLDHDGLQDLAVFDPGNGVRTFLNKGVPGNPDYHFAPEYALNFPPVYGYMIMADYNCDGITDLFQRGGDGFTVYKGYYNAGNQLCFAFYQSLFYSNDTWAGGWANAFCNPGDIPSVVDVDNDGDLDFVAYDIAGGRMNYYKNMQVELGLPCDSIRIALKDRCWGKVYQGFYRSHVLASPCDNSGLLRDAGGKVTHSGNTPCLFDWDMDGDMDYLDGSVSYNEMTFLKNGRIEYGGNDSMVSQDTTWQSGGHMIDIPIWPTAYNIDIDQDGKKDLLIAPNAGNASENYKCIWFYKNLSTPGSPNWQFKSDSFLTDKTIDLGNAASPMLFDYDKDGKLDLFIGSDGYRQPSGLLQSRLSYYRNTSAGGNTSFTLQSTDFMGISASSFKGSAPTTGDIDHDGKSDLILGHADGTLSYYKNMAASETVPPDWQLTQLQLKDVNGATINVDGNAAPFIYDMDKDGEADLIIGNLYGSIVYYQNVSTTAGAVRLKLVNTQLGNAYSDPLQNIGNFSTPFIGKIDSSGIDYLLMGSNSGNIYRYTGFQSGDTTATYTMLDDQYSFIDSTYNLYKHPGTAYGIYGNWRSSVAVGDIDGSGSYAMIVGNLKGGVEFYKRKVYTAATPPVVVDPVHVSVYPNPARDELNISWTGITSSPLQISIVSTTGQVVQQLSAPTAALHANISLPPLPAGIYICTLQHDAGRYYSKFTVLR